MTFWLLFFLSYASFNIQNLIIELRQSLSWFLIREITTKYYCHTVTLIPKYFLGLKIALGWVVLWKGVRNSVMNIICSEGVWFAKFLYELNVI